MDLDGGVSSGTRRTDFVGVAGLEGVAKRMETATPSVLTSWWNLEVLHSVEDLFRPQ